MRKFLLTLFCMVTVHAFSQENGKKIFGTISDDFGVLKDVNITIEGSETGTTSDDEGKYEIIAKEGDILVFSHVGMITMKTKVEDVTRVLNMPMYQKAIQLEDVTITKRILKSQQELSLEYDTNPNIIKSAFGYMDKETSNFSVRIMDESNTNFGKARLDYLINGRFAGIQGGCDNNDFLRVVMRSSGTVGNAGSGGAIIDLDGQILENFPCSMAAVNIRRIAFIPSRAAALRYGSPGANGVVIINTYAGSPSLKEKDGTPYDRARLRDNVYYNKALASDKVANNAPQYLKEIANSQNKTEAESIYEKYADGYRGSPFFALDMYRYFQGKWNDETLADKVISDQWTAFKENPVVLKALAYLYEEEGRYNKANAMYREVFIQRPNYLQSYFDMAESYRDMAQPKQSAAMYARYNYLVQEGFLGADPQGFGLIMEREFNNLLTLEKASVVKNGRDANALFVAKEDFSGTRLVFEWNDSEAEFLLQFVNPIKQYYTVKHTLFDDPETIEREKELGYSTTEYLIDQSMPGDWQVNIEYRGNKSLSPTFLKATIYYDYGTEKQKKMVKVFKLDLLNVNQELFTVNTIKKSIDNE